MRGGERRAEAAEAGDDLVEDEQDAVLVADRAQALEIALGRQQHAGRAGHRLDDHRRDGRRVMQRHESLQIVGQFGAMLGHAARVRIARQVMRMSQVVDAAQRGAEHLAVADDAAHRDAAEVDAVVTALPPDQPRARAFAARPVVGDGHLQRRVHRLRSGIGEEHLVQARRRELNEPLGQLEGLRVRHVEGRCVVEFGGLVGNRLHDLGTRVAGVHAPQPGDAVEDLAAFRRPEVHVLGAREQARRLLELPVRRERHPVRVHGVGVRRALFGNRQHGGIDGLVHGEGSWNPAFSMRPSVQSSTG